jgi:lipopolysaccharide biosynthesis protein
MIDSEEFRAAPRAVDIDRTWLKQPRALASADVCLLVTHAHYGIVSEHVEYHARAWQRAGFEVVLLVQLDDYEDGVSGLRVDDYSGVMVRRNVGYDFGAWAAGVHDLPELAQARLAVFVNDSIFGPLEDLRPLLARLDGIPGDVVGAVESLEMQPHLQSFLIFYRSTALRSTVFREFWSALRCGDRGQTIWWYELQLMRLMRAGGLSVASLHPAVDGGNPTLVHWRSLVHAGFPYLKAQLLRHNPLGSDLDGWRELVISKGYDVRLIDLGLIA